MEVIIPTRTKRRLSNMIDTILEERQLKDAYKALSENDKDELASHFEEMIDEFFNDLTFSIED